jgi:DNA-binding IclR family transcriptional regulator
VLAAAAQELLCPTGAMHGTRGSDRWAERSVTLVGVAGKASEDQLLVRSVVRAIDILLALQHGNVSLGRIAQRTGLSKPTAHRLLASLSHGQLVIQDPVTSEYMLGPGCLGIADAVMSGLGGLGPIARPTLEALSIDSGESSALHVRAGLQRICVEQFPSPQPVRYTARVGGSNPLHTGSMGKLLLAFSDPDDLSGILDRLPLSASTENTITDRRVLEAELNRIREVGYAVSRGEQAVGVAAMSAPVLRPDGVILAAMSILGPNNRLTDATLEKLRPLLIDAAREITERVSADTSVAGAAGAVDAD